MKTTSILICAVLLCLQTTSQTRLNTIDSAMRALGKRFAEDSLTASLSVGIVYKGETSFYNVGRQIPSEHSVYEIGSIAKTFVSLLLVRAVQEGKADLTDDVRKYMPGNFPGLEYKGHQVRLIHLANTSSGLPDNLPIIPDSIFAGAPPDSIPFLRERMATRFTRDDFYDALRKIKPDTIPGTITRHSNAAANLLVYILERIYGEPVDVLIRKYILEPLQMKETSFGKAPVPAMMLKGYTGKGIEAPRLTSGDAMRSTAADMVKYASYLLTKPDAMAVEALRQTVAVSARNNTVLEEYPKDTIDGSRYTISMNWLQYHPQGSPLRIWTDGGTQGFRSYIVIYPALELGMIFLSNRTGETIMDKMATIGFAVVKEVNRSR